MEAVFCINYASTRPCRISFVLLHVVQSGDWLAFESVSRSIHRACGVCCEAYFPVLAHRGQLASLLHGPDISALWTCQRSGHTLPGNLQRHRGDWSVDPILSTLDRDVNSQPSDLTRAPFLGTQPIPTVQHSQR